jgi:hypothetical protein
MFLGLTNLDPDLLFTGTDPDPSMSKQKIVIKAMTLSVLSLFLHLSLKNDVNVPLKSKSVNLERKKIFFCCVLNVTDEKAGSDSGSVSQKYGSVVPDPYQNVTDPQHCGDARPVNRYVNLTPPCPLQGHS